MQRRQAGIRGGNKSVLAGLQELRIGGDVLIAVDGKAITNQMDLNLMLNRSQPGDTVTLDDRARRQEDECSG